MISFFVTATDTDVGKTYASKGLASAFHARNKKVGYFKPFQSGVIEGEPTDAQIVHNSCQEIVVKNSYVTLTPCAPSLSAEIAGIEIDLEKVKRDYEELKERLDVVIVEGSGGLYVPVTSDELMSDVIKMLNIPVIIVARPDLGTVNHTLMTIKCLEQQGANILGVIISNYPTDSKDPSILNAKKMIEANSKYKVLAQIPINADVEAFERLTHLLEEADRL